jgi:rod shape-determining protein MreD
MTQVIVSQAERLAVLRARAVPIASTIVGSALALLPLFGPATIVPPIGLLMLLAWRMIRPELWPAWMGLVLGLIDDLITGQPIGTGMCIWTVLLLLLERADPRFLSRGYREEWLLVGTSLASAMIGGLLSNRLAGARGSLDTVLLPFILAVLLFPVAARLCAALDRWRLAR